MVVAGERATYLPRVLAAIEFLLVRLFRAYAFSAPQRAAPKLNRLS
jgi:hypothetical protein